MKITLITTGGTIDGAMMETATIKPHSALKTYLETFQELSVTSEVLCNKDSREITDDDRGALLEIISRAGDKILIGHGTYTMCETARFLKSKLLKSRYRIMFVGAWIPFGDSGSDASRQVNFAVEALRPDNPGIYIAMDGKLWDPDRTEKVKLANGTWQLSETL